MQQAASMSSSNLNREEKGNPKEKSEEALEVTTSGATSLQPPTLPTPASNTLVAVPPKKFNLAEPPEFCITLPQHLQTKETQRFFYGDAAYYFHVEGRGKAETRLGLSLDEIEKKLKALSAQYSAVLSAKGEKSDEFMTKIKELSTEISAKRQAIATMSERTGKEGIWQNISIYVKETTTAHRECSYLVTPEFEAFWNDVKSFGNLPHSLLAIRLVSDSSLAGLYDAHALDQFKNSLNLKPFLKIALGFIGKEANSYTFDNNISAINKIMKAFIELHEYLYRQQIMKKIVALHNDLAMRVKAGFSAKSGYGVLKKNVLNILYENSKVISSFKMFITYQGFCKKMSHLIDLIPDDEAQATKQDLKDCISDVDKDSACKTITQKYQKLVTRLYDALMAVFHQIQALDNNEFPNKWYNFKHLLLIINYLNSSENPFARQDPGTSSSNSDFHKEALTSFTTYQNALTDNTPVADLTDESLKLFCTQEGSVLSARLAEMMQKGLDINQIMNALSLKPSDSLLLYYLEGEHIPAAPKGAVAKQGVFSASGKNPPQVTARELVPATHTQATNAASTENKERDCRLM